MKMESLSGLLIEGVQEAYDAEQQLLEALPKMNKAAFTEELQEAFSLHTEQTRSQLKRVEELLQKLHSQPVGEGADGMKGIIAEAPKADPAVFDAALIAVAQRAEHYEIAVYGTLRTYSQILGEFEAVELLQLTLNEEVDTDRKLSSMAETAVNLDAAEADPEVQEVAAKETEESGAETLSGSPIK
jgi:ferritin-like metal-binding protein YciE